MSHNINMQNGKGSLFVVREPAWHGLGTVVEHALTSEEAIKTAQLDFTVIKSKNYTKVPSLIISNEIVTSKTIEVPSWTLLRTDTDVPLGTAGSRYEVIQNIEGFKFFDDIVGKKEAIFHTAGALGKGELVFISAKLPGNIRFNNDPDEQIDKYLLLSMSHDGSASIQAMFTPIRVVCNNTLDAALEMSKNKISIRHTKSARDRLSQAARLLDLVNIQSDEITDMYYAMSKFNLTTKDTKKFIAKLILTKEEYKILIDTPNMFINNISTKKLNILTDMTNYAFDGVGQKTKSATNSLWGTYNAISGYFNNYKSFKGDEEKRFKSVFGGQGAVMSNRALNMASKALTTNNINSII